MGGAIIAEACIFIGSPVRCSLILLSFRRAAGFEQQNQNWFLHHPPTIGNIPKKQVAGMSRTNSAILFGFFVTIVVAMCGVALLKNGLFLSKHEGDTFHMLDIVFRMAQGQWPHRDFVTPIGVFAFAPITLFVKLGFGIGTAFILAQTLMAALFLPMVWWATYSRMSGALAYFFGSTVLILFCALLHGQSAGGVSVSMHYNRWAWAISFIAIAIAMIPSKTVQSHRIDGVIIGLCLTAILLIKVTYFAAFAPPIFIALFVHRKINSAVTAIVVMLLVSAVFTFFAGLDFWAAYLRDILRVATSSVRPYPGLQLSEVVGAPAYLAASLVLIVGVVLLRQSGKSNGGLILLLLVPGFFYVTYQNFGNDPQWLLLLCVILVCFQPDAGLKNNLGWDLHGATKICAAVAFALIAPSYLNLAYSPFRHFKLAEEDYSVLLAKSEIHQDLWAHTVRAYRVNAQIAMDGNGTRLAEFREAAKRDDPGEILGESLPNCELELGMVAWFTAIGEDLDRSGLVQGKGIFGADLISPYWLFADTRPLLNGAPWYYGGLPGLGDAEFILVPLCPIAQKYRNEILATLDEKNVQLKEIQRTELYILYEKIGS